MLFRGRTVAAFLLVAVAGTALATLTVADRLLELPGIEAMTPQAAASRGAEGLSEGEIGKLEAVFSLIRTKFYREVDREKVVDGAVSGMIASLGDPYSVYMEKETAKHFSESVAGSFTGIGAEVKLQNGKVVVESAIRGTPAERAGLQPKDVILEVNGEKLEGLELGDAVAKIRGPKGTKAKLLIRRAGVDTPIRLVLVRDDIDYETVKAELLHGGIGRIELRQFSLNTAERFAEELAQLERQGMKGLVIDVRNNPGGALQIAEQIAGAFVPKGRALYWVEDRSGKQERAVSKGGGKPYPVAVLINKGSASAAEVLAAALQESAGSLLVGESSFGKGTVQISYSKPIGDGSQVKMTIAKWLTPGKRWVNEKGVEPDAPVAQPDYYTVARMSKESTLKLEAMGEDVRSLQIMLEAAGHAPGRKDGYYDGATKRAVESFQRAAGLQATGECDPATAERLEEAVYALTQDDANDRQLQEALRRIRELAGADAGEGQAVSMAGGSMMG